MSFHQVQHVSMANKITTTSIGTTAVYTMYGVYYHLLMKNIFNFSVYYFIFRTQYNTNNIYVFVCFPYTIYFRFSVDIHTVSRYLFHVFSFISFDDCVLFPCGTYCRRPVFDIWRKVVRSTKQTN